MFGALGLTATAAGCASSPQTPTMATTGAQPDVSTGARPDAAPKPRPRILLAYFSRPGENYWNGGRRTVQVGNTKRLAQMIADRIDCDTYEIAAADPYPASYERTVARNVDEERADARPVIAGALPDLAVYDTALLGCPVWNVQAPMIMSTFIESVDLRGREVLPFVTYAVSGMGRVEDDYRTALPDSTVHNGLAVRGETGDQAGDQLDTWLRAVDLLP